MQKIVAVFLIFTAASAIAFAQSRSLQGKDLDAMPLSNEEAREQLESYEESNQAFRIRFKEKYYIDQNSNRVAEKKHEVLVEIEPTQVLDFETPESCGEERNYLNSQIQKVANVYRLTRQESDHESKQNVPRQCLTFIMKKFFEPAMTAPKRMFAYCADATGRPEEDPASRGEIQPKIDILKKLISKKGIRSEEFDAISKKIRGYEASVKHKYYMQPCVTEAYTQTVYNAFTDVANCFNIPQREILPKIFNESGFHINAYGAGKDAGVGQLTAEAIDAALPKLPYYITEMLKSHKPSCRRLSQYSSSFASVEPDLFNRCNLIASPENPLRNLFYTAVFYRESLRYVSGITFRAGQDIVLRNDGQEYVLKGRADEELGGALERQQIREKFERLGYKDVNLHRLKTMIVSLGYNSGVMTALNRLNDYLNERIEHSAIEKDLSLNASHFDFENIDVRKLRKIVIPQVSKKEDSEEERSQIAKAEVARMKSLPDYYGKAYRLSFPEYLVLRTNSGPNGKEPYQLYGFPGYLSALALKNKILLSQFSGGECTTPGYLSLVK